mmetsp:Transcript_23116/g.47063  ORF Transcript_23116/g.47063 Transcript_23116/m.47063 type:complete len:201 (-) Transcript_23116:556-1158(-)
MPRMLLRRRRMERMMPRRSRSRRGRRRSALVTLTPSSSAQAVTAASVMISKARTWLRRAGCRSTSASTLLSACSTTGCGLLAPMPTTGRALRTDRNLRRHRRLQTLPSGGSPHRAPPVMVMQRLLVQPMCLLRPRRWRCAMRWKPLRWKTSTSGGSGAGLATGSGLMTLPSKTLMRSPWGLAALGLQPWLGLQAEEVAVR